MQTVTSRDGTGIALWSGGSGMPLLLVHGASLDHAIAWRLVRPPLERHFTVYAMDRRGRGGSGDASDYALQREAADVAAVIDSIPQPVTVLGHSYGGLCAIEAMLLTANVRRLILYEGVPLSGASYYAPCLIDRLERQLAAGDVEGMLIAMMREVIQRTPEEIERLRADRDDWAARVRNAPSVPRELRAEQRYVFVADRFRSMRVPTALLVGGSSPAIEHDNARGVRAGLPNAQIVVLPDQRHTAMITAPDLFVREVLRLLEA